MAWMLITISILRYVRTISPLPINVKIVHFFFTPVAKFPNSYIVTHFDNTPNTYLFFSYVCFVVFFLLFVVICWFYFGLLVCGVFFAGGGGRGRGCWQCGMFCFPFYHDINRCIHLLYNTLTQERRRMFMIYMYSIVSFYYI